MTDPIVGIDLGTTHSLVARMTGDGPRLIPNALGEVLTPSVVGVDTGGELLVGRAAQELMVTSPERCAELFKRQMGTEWTCQLDDRKFNAIELSSLVLRCLKEDAEAELGGPVRRAVVTVPAYFNEHQRTDTIRAGKIAGLAVERIINEPTAAALAYGLQESDCERIVLVFDLGGGTFDVSIVDQLDGVLEIRASSGEIFLGGDDFTSTLAARVLEMNSLVYEHVEMKEPARLSRLRRECEVAKRKLSREDAASIRLPLADGKFDDGGAVTVVSRTELEQWTKHILDRCDLPLRRALGDAGLKRKDIQEVILVGGATRMPAVIRRIVEIFGREPLHRINPDEVVALGAAVQAGLLAREQSVDEMVVTDVAPFTLGVESTRQLAGEYHEGYFLPIINRNTTIPVSRTQRVCTLQPNQTHVRIAIYQGEHRMVKQNLFLGEFEVTGIPRGPAGQEVDVRFTYDLNGVLEVEAEIVETKRKFQHVITRYARGMSPRQVEEAVRAMQELKRHPREEAANRFLLKRAERLYSEVPWDERDELEMLLRGFEEAMELRDEDAVERFRHSLEILLSRYDSPEDDQPYTDSSHEW